MIHELVYFKLTLYIWCNCYSRICLDLIDRIVTEYKAFINLLIFTLLTALLKNYCSRHTCPTFSLVFSLFSLLQMAHAYRRDERNGKNGNESDGNRGITRGIVDVACGSLRKYLLFRFCFHLAKYNLFS